MIAVIVEGEKREIRYWNSLIEHFFPEERYKIIPLPARANIYMLWNETRKDDVDIDIIEYLREEYDDIADKIKDYDRRKFDEIYLFFDYDPHQSNLPDNEEGDKVLTRMLADFAVETDSGKLYISYPMCEAIRDCHESGCSACSSCVISAKNLNEYKYLSSKSQYASVNTYTRDMWRLFTDIFLQRYTCLKNGRYTHCSMDGSIENKNDKTLKARIEQFKRECVSPADIFRLESNLSLQDSHTSFVLSAFPEFLIDYFPSDVW